MAAIDSMFYYLCEGNRVTTRQARTLFKIENVADVVYRLRNAGVPVYTNRVVTSRGVKSFAYQIGEPTKAYIGHIESRHISRARKTLYQHAISG